MDRNLPAHVGDTGSIPGLGRLPLLGAAEPGHHAYWAHRQQELKPVRLEPELGNRRSHRNGSPEHRDGERPLLISARERLSSSKDPARLKISEINPFFFFNKKMTSLFKRKKSRLNTPHSVKFGTRMESPLLVSPPGDADTGVLWVFPRQTHQPSVAAAVTLLTTLLKNPLEPRAFFLLSLAQMKVCEQLLASELLNELHTLCPRRCNAIEMGLVPFDLCWFLNPAVVC